MNSDSLLTTTYTAYMDDTPFPFMRLPLEIQRLVFQQYYQDPWQVCVRQGGRELVYGKPHYPDYVGQGRSKVLGFDPWLVSHHFYEEMKEALNLSRAGTLEVWPKSDVWRTFQLDAFYSSTMSIDSAITRLQTNRLFFTRAEFFSQLDRAKRRFVNLKVIDIGGCAEMLGVMSRIFNYITRVFGLQELITGKRDDFLQRSTHAFFSEYWVDIKKLDKMVIEWNETIPTIRVCSCSMTRCVVKHTKMYVHFATSKLETKIIAKKILDVDDEDVTKVVLQHLDEQDTIRICQHEGFDINEVV